MYSRPILLFFSLILSTFSIYHALYTEQIIGGYLAFPSNHGYHVAIAGKYNTSHYRYLVCSGGIIGEYFILSSSTCFFTKGFLLRKLTFFVLAGSTTISSVQPVREIEISKIYLAGFPHEILSSVLAVSKLKEGLGLHNNKYLLSLEIPYPNVTYQGSALVAGYGSKSLDPEKTYLTTTQQRLTYSGVNLTYAYVSILEDEDCEKLNKDIQKITHLCGVIKSDWRYQLRGLCMRDGGAPLVGQDNILLGVATKNNPDCNDTKRGSIYVKVPFYKAFIDSIMHEKFETPIVSVLTVNNRLHIL